MQDRMVHFEQVPMAQINRSKFDRSSRYATTMNADYLYPIFFDEVIPGDTKQLNTTVFGRMTTPFVPVMDNIYLDIHYWYVPYRLVWSNFKKFMGERDNPNDSIDYLEPQVESANGGFDYESLFDYLSIRPKVGTGKTSVSAKFSRAYNLIWNKRYRDENLQNSVTVDLDDGPDSASDYVLLKRGKRFDYFTSCLPSPQKGQASSIPLATTAAVYGDGNDLLFQKYSGNSAIDIKVGGKSIVEYAGGTTGNPVQSLLAGFHNNSLNNMEGSNLKFAEKSLAGSNSTGLYADLTSATAVTINSLRQAIALQQFLEKEMLGGSRYKELVWSHFSVVVPDGRVQDPEYLGGGTLNVNVHPIAQTSSSDNTSPQGNLAAMATVQGTGTGFTKSFTEHGIILGLASIRTDLMYQQGIDRMFSRHTRYDYYWPSFAHLGEQPVYNKEIYYQGDSTYDDAVFGYQERYAEYRYKNSYITGKLRSDHPNSLDIWHLAQDFSNLPTLSGQFIEQNSPIDRVLAVQNEPQFMVDFWHDLTDIRPIPVYGTPGLTRI